PVPVVAGNTFNQTQGVGVSFVPYGVSLNFTPFITDKDRVRLNMAASVSTRDLSATASIANTAVPGLNQRNFQTTVEMREGQTLAVAGLIQNNLGTDSNRIPGIGDIPILSNLTGLSQTQMAEQELIVLVTPELHHSMDHRQQPPLPGADLFEPSDLEFYLLGRLEGRRGKDYRSPVMNDCDRMLRFHRCEEQYIFGPTGFDTHP
ncbi:MAG TPA: type II and III secretion system protein, partial [Gemmataceae bacterium]|nr:type II and III secretion system protein [Gemmataceae bacterium]